MTSGAEVGEPGVAVAEISGELDAADNKLDAELQPLLDRSERHIVVDLKESSRTLLPRRSPRQECPFRLVSAPAGNGWSAAERPRQRRSERIGSSTGAGAAPGSSGYTGWSTRVSSIGRSETPVMPRRSYAGASVVAGAVVRAGAVATGAGAT